MSTTKTLVLSLWLAAAGSVPAWAETPGGQSGGPDQPEVAGQAATSDEPASPAAPSIASSLGPLGDPGGLRGTLAGKGITSSLTYIGETLGNASGGERRGAVYQGRLELSLDADLDRLLGWSGAAFHTNAYQIHGRGLSRYYVGNLLTTSGIEALSSTRLFELWLEQKFFEGKLAIRAGQLAADSEFLLSQYGGLFVNSTFGWPGITAANLPSGGPAYPLATPGARVKLQPTEDISILGAIFNGDPAGPGANDPQERNRDGLAFRTRDPAFLIGEVQYAYNQGKDAPGLPGTFKVGGWHHLARFDDQRFDGQGLSLADPASSGVGNRLRGNSGVYAVLDQMVYRGAGGGDQGIGVFARLSGSPSDRNLVSFYADGGITFKGLIPGREDDTFGISAGYALISREARGLDQDLRRLAGADQPVRSSEAVLEVTYQAQIIPGWTVQPDFQYIFRPGGNVANPRDPDGRPIKDAAIFGLRSTVRY